MQEGGLISRLCWIENWVALDEKLEPFLPL